jgi:hypothetical protein|nr:MAG TPA: hypothetical protein [Caudoviricetes sp.]
MMVITIKKRNEKKNEDQSIREKIENFNEIRQEYLEERDNLRKQYYNKLLVNINDLHELIKDQNNEE